jgi:hypothetical protein
MQLQIRRMCFAVFCRHADAVLHQLSSAFCFVHGWVSQQQLFRQIVCQLPRLSTMRAYCQTTVLIKCMHERQIGAEVRHCSLHPVTACATCTKHVCARGKPTCMPRAVTWASQIQICIASCFCAAGVPAAHAWYTCLVGQQLTGPLQEAISRP